VSETVALLAEAGAAGFSIEDYDPATEGIDAIDIAVERVATAGDAKIRTYRSRRPGRPRTSLRTLRVQKLGSCPDQLVGR
jgi:hypothetical protein